MSQTAFLKLQGRNCIGYHLLRLVLYKLNHNVTQLSEDIILNERYNLAAKSFIDVDKLEAVPDPYPN